MFSDKHWIELLGLLGIPSKPVESLVFGDFLAAKENILVHAQALQVLCNLSDTIEAFKLFAYSCLDLIKTCLIFLHVRI